MKKIYFGFLVCCLCSLAGCANFLEEDSKENMYATSCNDLNELLVGDGYMAYSMLGHNSNASFNLKQAGAYFPWLNIMDDDVEEVVVGEYSDATARYKLYPYYIWEGNPYNEDGVEYNDPNWGRLYEHIAVTNVVLDKVEDFTEDPEELRRSVKGQSYFLRAAYYYLLVNLYAKPYDPVSAASDPGVPVKLTPYVEDLNYKRTPVDSVYMQIVKDLKLAIDHLDGYKPATKRRATKSAAELLLSRVYCYMGQWDSVPALCRSVRNTEGLLLKDLTSTRDTAWVDINSPEVIFTQGGNTSYWVFLSNENVAGGRGFYKISKELQEVYAENNDKRWALAVDTLAQNGPVHYVPRKVRAWYPTQQYSTVSDIFTLRVSEAYLNEAEAYAMTGNDAEARAILEKLMKTRIVDLKPLTESGEELVRLIRKERRRELCFEGQRWFDLRRYAVSPKYPETKKIVHAVYDYAYGDSGTPGILRGYYELPEYPDGGWVMPIPDQEIEQNDGSIVNNSREDALFRENY